MISQHQKIEKNNGSVLNFEDTSTEIVRKDKTKSLSYEQKYNRVVDLFVSSYI